MNVYRLAAIVTFLTTGMLGSSLASARAVDNGFTFDHTATPTLTSGQESPKQGTALTRQEVKQELTNAQRDGDMRKLDSTVYFGAH